MTVPVQHTQVVAKGLSRLTSAFITKPNIRAMLAVYLQPEQDLENAIWAVINARILTKAAQLTLPATNIVFDVFGQLVGVQRGGLSDAQMLAIILLQVAVNRSAGRTTDWSGFAAILAAYSSEGPEYIDGPAAFDFGLWNLTLPALTVASVLSRAVPNGVSANLDYTTWVDIGTDIECGSVYDATAGQSGLGSVYSTTSGGVLASSLNLQNLQSAPAFSPLFLAPIAWYRSDLGVNLGGGNVQQWLDQSGNGHTLNASGPTNRPNFSATGGVNGLPILTFVGTSLVMALQGALTWPGGTTVMEHFIVATPNSAASFGGSTFNYLIDFGSNVMATVLRASDGGLTAYDGTLNNTTEIPPLHAPFVVGSFWNTSGAAADNLALNGGVPQFGASGGFSAASTGLTIGNYGSLNNPCDAAFYEVLIFPRQLLNTERASVLAYISSRYGIVT